MGHDYHAHQDKLAGLDVFKCPMFRMAVNPKGNPISQANPALTWHLPHSICPPDSVQLIQRLDNQKLPTKAVNMDARKSVAERQRILRAHLEPVRTSYCET